MHPSKNIGELFDLVEDRIFAIYGTVDSIVCGQEWWYSACKCHRSVLPDSGAYYCNMNLLKLSLLDYLSSLREDNFH
ncbi:replication factor A protein [Trifolium medium]|uniref:Replication factor A protein n=1 Tax=Trifolium medium TaxID=97028 RepID=A0A392R004_9FABA|nr:replication factor A protein [Trifolium medium]